jgi:hypothetical protein
MLYPSASVLWSVILFFWIWILLIIFWPEYFLNGASHCVHICSGNCTGTTGKKVFYLINVGSFSLSSVWSAFFHKIVILLQRLDPNPNSNPNFFQILIQIQSTKFGFSSITLISIVLTPNPLCFVSGANLLSNTLSFSYVYPLYDVYTSLVPNLYSGR